jgi:ubiquinone/menaquinone biosynthesis C-methylase UbiE
MIMTAKAKVGKVADLRVSDSETLPFKNGSFDLVTCTFSFHHYPNPKGVLLEIQRVLSPEGRLIMADPLAPFPLRQVLNFLVPLRKDGTVRYYSKKEMLGLAKNIGFKVSKWKKLNWHIYMMVAQ